ncbi:hypothetical protein ALC57_11276 [Trachymyrmex cornetzi]|uniref:Uncharacterized protein n=1 Tax=Trachymyrmex cornetzi TaxID=471704 RepID=A0A195DU74_9HYME|nr:hypothetical protein ALC57_11276 [Trachymyrmex cornetzi]
MSLSRPVLIKVRTLSICFIIVELTSTDSTDPRDEEVRGETRRGEGEQMSVKVMGEKLADTRSKVSLASSDRLRLDACALFGETAVVAALLAVEETDESHLRQWRLIAVVSSGVLSGPQSTKKEIGGRVEGKMREAVVAEEEGMEVKGVFTLLMMTTRRGLSLDVIDVAGHEVGMERTVLRTRTTSALVIGRPRPLQILGYRRISPGFWWLSNASALAFEHRERSGSDRRLQ